MKKVNRLTFERFIKPFRRALKAEVYLHNRETPVTLITLNGNLVAKKVYRTPTAIPFRVVTSYYIEETDANNH